MIKLLELVGIRGEQVTLEKVPFGSKSVLIRTKEEPVRVSFPIIGRVEFVLSTTGLEQTRRVVDPAAHDTLVEDHEEPLAGRD